MAKSESALDRGKVEEYVAALRVSYHGEVGPDEVRDALLAHDAALRARIEELEEALEDLCALSPDCGHYTVPPKHWVRARRALESDHGEQDDG